MINRYLFLSGLIFLFASSAFAQSDAADCEDHPLITRFPSSVLQWCNADNFSEYHIATGPETGYRQIGEWVDLEGKVFRYNYELTSTTTTMSEVYLNYRNALQRAGFEILVADQDPNRDRMKARAVSGKSWVGTAFLRNPLPSSSKTRLHLGSSSSGGYGYVAAKLERPEGNTFIVVTTYQYRSDMVVAQIDIIEEAPLEDGKITVDPDYLAREIAAKGSVALYGIHFDFDKAIVKPESEPELAVVAAYLEQNPTVKLYVVGHTDYQGKLDYNIELSRRRAAATVAKLTTDHQVAASRLEAHGVGSLAPKTTNESEAGRKMNRRVELVLRME